MLAQLDEIETLAARSPSRVEVLARVDGLPIRAFHFGRGDAVLLVTGGVHGLERIGTDVAIAYLASLIARLAWDELLARALETTRIVVVPLVNPVGMVRGTRANGRGVDLMRNAPAATHAATPLIGGQRLSRHLPYFMGDSLEPETAALIGLVERACFAAPFSLALDLHSGFGMIDRLWYPYAHSLAPPPDAPALAALGTLLDEALPNHVYKLEQTAQSYTIRGDLWDYLYDQRRARGGGTLLSITLEMGSWAWVRKNPWQGLFTAGRFNPIVPHRLRRTLRRHLPLLDFLFAATASHGRWLP